ncbi:MAG: serine/threonine-protein kinase [Pseudomonadota bacterium]
MNDGLIVIPGYTVHGRLGLGGMAEVYLATQDSLQRKVAVKVLLSANDEAFNRRFINEGKLVASLSHPSIITIHDIDRLDDSRYFIAMEFVPGGDLTQFKGRTLAPERALAITRQIAEGLSVVHEQGLIHRDIKPANILFRHDGTVVITDFGIAKDLGLDTELTHFGIAVGSPSYSSPEQAQCEPLDQRSDIYSLGVILLEMLTGQNTYRGTNYTQTVLNHLQLDIPTLPHGLGVYQGLLDRMLAKDPAQRFANCKALLAELDILSEQALDQTRPSPALQVAGQGQAAPRRKLPRMAMAVLGLALLVGLLLAAGVEIRTRLQLAEFIDLGEQRLAEGKLTAPEQDSADYFYRQALALDSANPEAAKGLERVQAARVEQLLRLAEQALADLRLTTPPQDSAVFYFGQVLLLAPDNQTAMEGLQRIVERCIEEARLAHANRDYPLGLSFIEQGLAVAPNNDTLNQLLRDNRRGPPVPRAVTPAPTQNPLKRIWNRIVN